MSINAFRAYFQLSDELMNSSLGDVNGDGAITVTDVMGLVNYILGNANENFIIENANINGDGNITVTDVMLLVKWILGDGKKLYNVVVNTGDETITYDGGGNGPARAGENHLWSE